MIYFVGDTRLIDSNLYKQATIKDCLSFLKNDCSIVATDTETEGFFDHQNKIVMLQLSNSIDSFVIDVRSVNILPLKEELESKLHILQNAKFDYKFLKFHGIEIEHIIDTFLNECILTNGLQDRRLGLDSLALKYCGKQLDKSVRNQFTKLNGRPFTDTQIVYGVEDTMCLHEIAEKQLIELKKWNLLPVAELEYKACLALADIEYNGIKLDTIKWLELAKKAISRIPKHEAELEVMVKKEPKLSKYIKSHVQLGMFGKEDNQLSINWASPTQVNKVFKDLGLEIDSTSEKEIQKYQNQYPLIKKFIDYKKDAKLVSTYGKDFIRYVNPVTKRIHADFFQILETFRVSCGGSKSKNKNSVNLQNLPANNDYLNCFVADKEFKIIGIDYAAQEARIAAYGSKDELWLNTFLQGKDLHSEVCKLMFNITDDLVRTKPDFLRGKTYRDVAKTINFGVLFGMSKFKLSNTLQISIDEADKLIKKYFLATKQLKSYLDRCARYGLSRGYIRSFSPYSIVRWFPEWRLDLDEYRDSKIVGEITRASFNTPIQASGAIMTKLSLVKIRKYIKENNLQDLVKLVHVIHDCTMTECHESIAEEFSLVQAKLMQEAGKEFTEVLNFETDITITTCWTK